MVQSECIVLFLCVFSFPVVMIFLDPCLLPIAGITPTCLSNAIEPKVWEKDPPPGKPVLLELVAGAPHAGPYLVPCQEAVVWVKCPPFCPCHLQRELSRNNVMSPTKKLSGVSKSWGEWPVKTGLCQKWWIVFVDFEQLANRSGTV